MFCCCSFLLLVALFMDEIVKKQDLLLSLLLLRGQSFEVREQRSFPFCGIMKPLSTSAWYLALDIFRERSIWLHIHYTVDMCMCKCTGCRIEGFWAHTPASTWSGRRLNENTNRDLWNLTWDKHWAADLSKCTSEKLQRKGEKTTGQ